MKRASQEERQRSASYQLYVQHQDCCQRNEVLNREASAQPTPSQLYNEFTVMESFWWTSGSTGQNCCTAAAAVTLRSSNGCCWGPALIWSVQDCRGWGWYGKAFEQGNIKSVGHHLDLFIYSYILIYINILHIPPSHTHAHTYINILNTFKV